jgi:hypothetical protein
MSNQIKTNGTELEPAYGRDYKSAAEVEQAFRIGQDFLGDYNMGFKPCGIADFATGVRVQLRYKKNTRVAVITV